MLSTHILESPHQCWEMVPKGYFPPILDVAACGVQKAPRLPLNASVFIPSSFGGRIVEQEGTTFIQKDILYQNI